MTKDLDGCSKLIGLVVTCITYLFFKILFLSYSKGRMKYVFMDSKKDYELTHTYQILIFEQICIKN